MKTLWEERFEGIEARSQHAVDALQPPVYWCVPLPRLFGSMGYGLSSPTSDVDLVVFAPANVVKKGDDIRAYTAGRLCNNGIN